MRWSSAASDAPEAEEAVASIVSRLQDGMHGDSIDLAVLFVSQHFAARYAEVPGLLRQQLRARCWIGCSAGGVIGGGHEIEQRPGIALTVAHLPGVSLTPWRLDAAAMPNPDAPPGAWQALCGVPPEPLPQFIVLADPFTFPAEQLLEGLDYAYPRSTKIGGLASGGTQPGANALYLGDQVLRAGAVGVALSGDLRLETVVAQGCRPIGRPMQITSCQENILLELDGKSPLQVVRDLIPSLDDHDRELIAQARFLGVLMDELASSRDPASFLIRNIIGIDPASGAFAIGERLRNGQTVQFHLRDARTSAEELGTLLGRFAAQGGSARGALLFSCLGRGLYLYGQPDHDTGIFRDVVGDVPLGGFFCNGEIGPVGGRTHLHGYTSSFGLFRSATD